MKAGEQHLLIRNMNDTWNIDLAALEKAFEISQEVRLVVVAHLFEVPGKIDED